MKQPATGRKPMVERVAAHQARKDLSELMNRARFGGERFVVTRNGDDYVLVIGVQDPFAAKLLDVA